MLYTKKSMSTNLEYTDKIVYLKYYKNYKQNEFINYVLINYAYALHTY